MSVKALVDNAIASDFIAVFSKVGTPPFAADFSPTPRTTIKQML